MFEKKYNEITTAIKDELIKEYGIGFLRLSKHHQNLLMSQRLIELIQAQRERQV